MINKIVTHAGTFHADEVLATAFLKSLYPGATVERTFTPTEEDFNNPETAVLDIGRQYNPRLNNFDHHQDANLPATNMLVLQKWEHPQPGEWMAKLLFQYVSDVDTGKIVEPSTQPVPTFSSIIRMLNNVDGGFEIALQIADAAIKAARQTAIQRIAAENTWRTLEKRNCYAVHDSLEFVVGWQELAEKEGVNFLLMQNPRGGYQIYSRDSSKFPIPPHESQTFLHNSKFTATYPTKELAITHLEAM